LPERPSFNRLRGALRCAPTSKHRLGAWAYSPPPPKTSQCRAHVRPCCARGDRREQCGHRRRKPLRSPAWLDGLRPDVRASSQPSAPRCTGTSDLVHRAVPQHADATWAKCARKAAIFRVTRHTAFPQRKPDGRESRRRSGQVCPCCAEGGCHRHQCRRRCQRARPPNPERAAVSARVANTRYIWASERPSRRRVHARCLP
jgi:hypothetical protein